MYPLENCFLAGNWPGSEAVLHISRIDSDPDFYFQQTMGKKVHFGKLHYKNLCLAHVNFGE